MSVENVIEVRGLRNQFGDHVVHDNLDLDLRRGEILGVVGGSGTGKSVLLRSIVGLVTPQAGEIRVFGQDIRKLSGPARESVERRWGVNFQDGALFSALTVRENVEVPLRAVPHLSDEDRERLAGLKVSMAGLPVNANPKFPSDLSGGMRKRAGLARALALDPEILFLDEPTAGLDPHGVDEMVAALAQLEADATTVVICTHEVDFALGWADTAAVLVDGTLRAGDPTELLGDADLIGRARLRQPVVLQVAHRLGLPTTGVTGVAALVAALRP